MAIEVSDLNALSQASVDDRRELLAQLLQEYESRVDLKRGVIHDLLLELSAVISAAHEENIERLRLSNSLQGIIENPELSDPTLVDKVLSNYRLTRKSGSAASGQVTIVVNRLAPVTIETGAEFEANAQTFSVASAVIARTSTASVQSDSDKVLTPLGDGNYAFTVSVVADQIGLAGRVKKDTLFVPSVAITNFVKAYASADFTGGAEDETNEELTSRLEAGLACKALSNRSSMTALLMDRFPYVVASSIIGYGDGEMLRDRHSIFPFSFGGRTDWYVRTSELPINLGISVTATLMSKDTADGSGIWQFSLPRDVAPGFYDIKNIRLSASAETAGTFAITSQIRGFDLTPETSILRPDIENSTEAAFSRYQTNIVRFRDPLTITDALSVGATKDYAVTLRHMPGIKDIQLAMSSRDTRYSAGDVLVKAAVPCFMSVSFTIEGKSGLVLPDATTLKSAIAALVNNSGFCGKIYASQILDVVHGYLSKGLAVANLDMFAQILKPNGSVISLRSQTAIAVPNTPSDMVTPRTVCFVLDPEDIAISARTINVP